MAEQVSGQALEVLLTVAEREWCRTGQKTGRLPMTDSRFKAYGSLRIREDVDAMHHVLIRASKSGAIALEWDRRAGPQGSLTCISVLDADGLSALVGRKPVWVVFGEAAEALAPFTSRRVVVEILERWRLGKTVRSKSVDSYRAFADALLLVAHCETNRTDVEVAVRRVSGKLFKDTKRVEDCLMSAIDVVTAERIDDAPRDEMEVLGNLGLVRFPHPLLIAGDGVVDLVDGSEMAIVKPYVGLPPECVRSLPWRPAYVLSVENLTTFHELARCAGGAIDGVVLYTGGMPSRQMRRAYRALLGAIPGVPTFHWGDTDVGGLRIASVMAREAASMDCDLRLWQMGSDAFVSGTIAAKLLTPSDVEKIMSIVDERGWSGFDDFRDSPWAIEQETQSIPDLRSLGSLPMRLSAG